MEQKRVIFLGSKPIGYDCFQYLVTQQEQLGIQVTGLLTQNRSEFEGNSDLKQIAEAHHIPLISSLDELPECDILYSVQYHQILKAEHIAKAKQIAVNLHMAPLPEYRGSNQFSYAIIDGKQEFGTTIHEINPKIDNGDILFQTRFAIPEKCWVEELYKLTYEASAALFSDSLEAIVEGRYTRVPQASLVAKYGTSLHYRNEINELKEIDLGWDKEKIERHIRATSMPGFELPYFMIDGKKVHFTGQ